MGNVNNQEKENFSMFNIQYRTHFTILLFKMIVFSLNLLSKISLFSNAKHYKQHAR